MDIAKLPSPNTEVGFVVVVEDGLPNTEPPVPPPTKIEKSQYDPIQVCLLSNATASRFTKHEAEANRTS